MLFTTPLGAARTRTWIFSTGLMKMVLQTPAIYPQKMFCNVFNVLSLPKLLYWFVIRRYKSNTRTSTSPKTLLWQEINYIYQAFLKEHSVDGSQRRTFSFASSFMSSTAPYSQPAVVFFKTSKGIPRRHQLLAQWRQM